MPSDRARLLDAIATEAVLHGIDHVDLDRVLFEADLDAAVFNKHFRDLDEALRLAFEGSVAHLHCEVENAFSVPRPWPERIRSALTVFVDLVERHPSRAHLAMIEVLSGGPDALARYQMAVRSFTSFFEAGREASPHRETLPSQTSTAVVGGIAMLVQGHLRRGDGKLAQLTPQLIYFAVLPYHGHATALLISGAKP
jgi:AcrR family transcriptional regulator